MAPPAENRFPPQNRPLGGKRARLHLLSTEKERKHRFLVFSCGSQHDMIAKNGAKVGVAWGGDLKPVT